ncbi:hypothetical protein A2572_02605 [Candidatus Collierbacteria bacterium RIFOXYD1_FULL_40_9]|uniref:Uncharacterized protein n=1 Tax=Candidatus Collierbacteria bacterium RIFOXYD1_FULL_40_9 TaxID=1817731 RepID=A0A1F5FW69_9BACT|nr:MAG: hypothetical protein A2572_02605 [Candidatus Collierbacteria bacterium RIFOXYD1_FULL_40_9]
MSNRDSAVIIAIATIDGKLQSINYNEDIVSKGEPVQKYLSYLVCEAKYDMVGVFLFVLSNGDQRVQYTLQIRD